MTSEQETKLLAQHLTEAEVHIPGHNFYPKVTASETRIFTGEQACSRRKPGCKIKDE
jgi:hypothetical protein